MTLKPMKKPPQKKPEMQVKLSDTENYNCVKCGNIIFRKTYTIKRVSPLLSPTKEELMVPVEIFSCAGCGVIPATFLERSGLDVELAQLEKDASEKE